MKQVFIDLWPLSFAASVAFGFMLRELAEFGLRLLHRKSMDLTAKYAAASNLPEVNVCKEHTVAFSSSSVGCDICKLCEHAVEAIR